MSEKRKSRRVTTPESLAVKDPETRVTLGFLVDLSTGGMMLTGEGPFHINKTMTIKIVLPYRVMGARHLELKAICRWKTKTPSRGMFSAGYEFPQVSAEQELMINLIQAEYVVRALPAANAPV